MTARPSNNFSFTIGNIIFSIDKEDLEMFPGCETQMVTIDYEYKQTKNEAGVCLKSR